MKNLMAVALAAGLIVLATPALAAEQATSRDIQAAVDSYVASADQDATLVGGPGSAGYDAGFWIRGGDFSLRINLTLQARFEWWKESKKEVNGVELAPVNNQVSGFSLPRATVKFSGTAPCDIRYYLELEFGHPGFAFNTLDTDVSPTAAVPNNFNGLNPPGPFQVPGSVGPFNQTHNFLFNETSREAWIEWGCSPTLNLRMGQIKLATTRQLMVAPELQQFIDISYASAFIGHLLPGYTDRNRDFGVMLHGAFGCNNEFSWMLQVTNGDSGDSVRNIWNDDTDDNFAFGGRLNWCFLGAIGYEEGALRQNTCEWYGEFGAWAYYMADRTDDTHNSDTEPDWLLLGADIALGSGGFSFTGAFNYVSVTYAADPLVVAGTRDATAWTALAQAGFLFPDTAWEIAARWSLVNFTPEAVGAEEELTASTMEFAGVINYYLNGHGNKLSLDFSYFVTDDEAAVLMNDVYTGIHDLNSLGVQGTDRTGFLFRFQWQLAL